MQALYKFNSFGEFKDFYDKRPVFKNWDIWGLDLKDRAKRISKRPYFQEFKNQFNSNGMYKYNVSSSEIVSWCDTLKMLYDVFFTFEVADLIGDDVSILMEYQIPYSNSKRIDYMIIKGEKVLVLEFGMTFESKKLKNTFQKKLNEAIQYKELISNFTPISTKVGVYSFVYLPEFDDEGDLDDNHMDINHANLANFANFLIQFFSNKRITQHVLSNVLAEWEE